MDSRRNVNFIIRQTWSSDLGFAMYQFGAFEKVLSLFISFCNKMGMVLLLAGLL